MRGEVRDGLRRWLGEDARVLDGLSEREVEDLHRALVTARQHQARALAAASEEALRQMPALVRKSIAGIVGR